MYGDSKVLGSKALFTLVSTVAGGVEHLCRLEAGRLTNKLLSNTQLARSLTAQAKALKELKMVHYFGFPYSDKSWTDLIAEFPIHVCWHIPSPFEGEG